MAKKRIRKLNDTQWLLLRLAVRGCRIYGGGPLQTAQSLERRRLATITEPDSGGGVIINATPMGKIVVAEVKRVEE
jgi:hypothetical protein